MKRLILAAVICAAAMPSLAADVKQWNVGSGQVNGNFVTSGCTSMSSGEVVYELELGLRPQERYVGPSYVPVDGVYYVDPGYLGSGAVWNFDVSVYVAGADGQATQSIDDLYALTLDIQYGNGMYNYTLNLLDGTIRNWLDAHTYDYINPGPANPTNFYQGSENLAWMNLPNFDADANQKCTFTLSATDASSCVYTVAMDVVVPEPASISMLALGAIALIRRRKK